MQIQESKFKVIVKPNSCKNELLGFDAEKKAYRLNISAPPEDNEANKEIIRFLSRMLKKRVIIVSGLRSKEKIIQVI